MVCLTLDKRHVFIPTICFQLVKQNQDTYKQQYIGIK